VTIEGRGTELDLLGQQLVSAVRSEAGSSGVELAAPLEPISGGFWARSYGVALRDAPAPFDRALILRVMPDEHLARREIAIQCAVGAQSFPCPAVRLADGSSASLGAPFMLMDRAEGRPLLSDLSLGRALPMLPALFRKMPALFGQTLAQLHALDPEPARQALAAAGVLDDIDGVEPYMRGLRGSDACDRVVGFADAVRWLDEHMPADGRRVICHGDFHPLNLLTVGLELQAVIDWTGGRIADPAYDVGFTAVLLAQAPIDVPRLARPAVAALGRWLARRFKAEYQARDRVDDATVGWYEVLQAVRMLDEVARGRLRGGLENRSHPFETMAAGLVGHVAGTTGITIELPAATPVDTGAA
jgi:aminoglycoside phosphotransferase (APT) family kinase protein